MPPVRRFTLAGEGLSEARELAAEIRSCAPAPPGVEGAVGEILAAVREGGDAAVLELTRRFDSEVSPAELRVAATELQRALDDLDPPVRKALDVSIERVASFSERESAEGSGAIGDPGVVTSFGVEGEWNLALLERPVRRAGAYVPGGRAAYPSTAVMCCIPARVAGVEQVVVATPPGRDGRPDDTVLAACAMCDVSEVYAMGGAQAIAALAFGTETVEPVEVIVGPGSHYVQEAKRQVIGRVGIDGIAGPTELVVVGDESADPDRAAIDLAAQAEHGSDSLLVFMSPSDEALEAVRLAYAAVAASRSSVSDAPLALVRVPTLRAVAGLANAIAPEHLELMCDGAEELAGAISASGCIFIDAGAAFGDYAAGSNHVLPTGGAARFSSPLGVATFRHRQALVSLPDKGARALAPYVSALARAEGFPVHAESAEARARPSAKRA